VREPSKGESEFALHCRLELPAILQPFTEYQFHQPRLWRFDFCWPSVRLAVEIESSVHRIRGRFARDLDKYNQAALDGWKLLRYTAKMVHSAEAIDTVKRVLGVP